MCFAQNKVELCITVSFFLSRKALTEIEWKPRLQTIIPRFCRFCSLWDDGILSRIIQKMWGPWTASFPGSFGKGWVLAQYVWIFLELDLSSSWIKAKWPFLLFGKHGILENSSPKMPHFPKCDVSWPRCHVFWKASVLVVNQHNQGIMITLHLFPSDLKTVLGTLRFARVPRTVFEFLGKMQSKILKLLTGCPKVHGSLRCLLSPLYTVYHLLEGRGFVCFVFNPASVHGPKPWSPLAWWIPTHLGFVWSITSHAIYSWPHMSMA